MWDVKADAATKMWYLEFSFITPVLSSAVLEHLFCYIGPADQPWEVAVDAGLEFLDRLRTGVIPKDIEDPDELMGLCWRNARRQR